MKKLFCLFVATLMVVAAAAQTENPVKWSYVVKGAELHITAKTALPWHMYDMGPYEDGPNATMFRFRLPSGVSLDGPIRELDKPERKMDDIFGMKIGVYGQRARFVQKFRNGSGDEAKVAVTVEWQVCDETSCLPPDEYDFTATIPPTEPVATTTPTKATAAVEPIVKQAEQPTEVAAILETDSSELSSVAPQQAVVSGEVSNSYIKDEQKSMLAIIIEAILWGFAALVTPCVFPMVPMTVSFFIKGNSSKARGRFMAMLYGVSIIALYTLPVAIIIAISYFGGGESITVGIFNWMATHWIPNVLFFAVFMVFAASFFGAFEITMPSKLVNRADSQADKGGFVGVFFMAITLVLVSFSCTGPIVSSILFKSTQGEVWEPIVTMFAFSAAFALPFTIFALFPSLLKNLPKSGGWLNSVKVVLGFIELALGLKFLSVADQTYHWGLLDREVYLALWIVIFSLLGLYLLGKLRFAHDSPSSHISVKRLFLAIFTFSFVVYMIPGMWGAPLKVLSGYLPPVSTMDFNVTASSAGASSAESLDLSKIKGGKPKYSDFLHLPHGLQGFFDFKEGMEYARAVGKPVFLDFTGHGCVNCREMEANVWSDPAVLKILSSQYVIIALYTDDRKELPQSDWVVDSRGKTQTTLGKINGAWQVERFGVIAQPYYVLLDPVSDEMLVAPRAYSLDVAGFVQFLEQGVAVFQQKSAAAAL